MKGPSRDEIIERVMTGKAWSEFCALLEQAGETVLDPGNPADLLDRAEGFRTLTRLLRGALESHLEHNDPLHPRLVCTCHETIKVVAENPDNLYLGARIDGQYDYRIRGTRGEARWISFNTYGGGGFGAGGRGTGPTLHEKDLRVSPDGRFELMLSQREHPGNWLRLEPDTRSLTIRQTFLDKRRPQPAELEIECLAAEGSPPAPLDPIDLYRALLVCGHYVRAVNEMGASWARRQSEHPNRFVHVQSEDTRRFKDPQIAYHQAYFELDPEEALVVEFMPPACDYWMIVLHNHWMETLDYRYHTVTLNNASAHLERDGSVRCVVAAHDPGLPNWLDSADHRRGTIGVRWVGENVRDVVPTTRRVPLAELKP